jgi:hypothetical protein
MRSLLVFLSCLFCSLFLLAAQHEHPTASRGQVMQHSGSEPEEIGWVPREILDRPVSLRDGLGPVHEKVTTPSPEAQKYYDQGLGFRSMSHLSEVLTNGHVVFGYFDDLVRSFS